MKTQITEEQAASAATGAAREPKATTKATAAPQKPRVAPAPAKSRKKATGTRKARKRATGARVSGAGTRPGSKTAKVLALLKRPGGATAKELMKATGWLPHSVRGFLSGTVGKKMGLAVSSAKPDGGERSYSVKA